MKGKGLDQVTANLLRVVEGVYLSTFKDKDGNER